MEKKKKNEKPESQTETPPEEQKPPEAEAVKETETPKEPDNSEKLAALETELAAAKDRCLRIAAEYENYRRRSTKERENIYGDAVAMTVGAILPILDNLERAAALPTEDEAYKKGIDMTLKQFEASLEKLGVKEIKALGEQFDPNLHNAVMHVEQEGCDDNTVVEVFQKGFIMGERVVRHSIVKVAN